MGKLSGNRQISTKDKLTISCILLISILGSFAIIYTTKWGPWIFSDSVEYIFSARNLIAGDGLGLYGASGDFVPLSLHPPFYSLVLSIFGFFGADLLASAGWINVILFGLTILLVGVSLYTFTRSSWLAIISSLFLISMPAMVDIFSGAMSEPLFIFTGLAGMSLVFWFIWDDRFFALLAAALFSGMSMFTRYIGLAFIITGIFGLLVFNLRPLRKRIFSVLIYGVISCIPTISWIIWLNTHAISVRNLQPLVNIPEQFTRFRLGAMEIFWSWLPFPQLLPEYSYNLARNLLFIFFVLILCFSFLIGWKLRRDKLKFSLIHAGIGYLGLMIVFVLAYLAVLCFSYVFTYPTPDLIERTLLPVQIGLLLIIFLYSYLFIRLWSSKKWLVLIPIILAIGISFSYLTSTIQIATHYHRFGSGYNSLEWRTSSIIQKIKQLSPEIPLISNDSALVLFHTGVQPYGISALINPEPGDITSRFGDDPADPAQRLFRENEAALVLFKSNFWQFEQIYGDQTVNRLENFTRGLYLYAESGEGKIYFFSSQIKP